MHSFDWQSSNNQILFNPRYSQEELRDILKMLENGPSLKNHFWIATSGSTSLSQGQIKWTALSKEAVLVSAAAVNEFLECTSSDIWLNFLPYFHVGGLGIFARAYLSTSLVIDGYALRRPKWDPEKAYDLLCAHNATLTSLVPAQLFDFVRLQKTTPPTLRAVIVGGGALSDSIYSQAKDLGWKVLPSYGLTECASQVATASPQMDPILETPKLKLLPHIEAKETSEGRIALKSPALLTLYAIKNEKGIHYVDPKKDGWFETEDLGEVRDRTLNIKGRQNHLFKIGGESVDLLRLERILDTVKLSKKCTLDMVLLPMPDERLGHVIHLAAVSQDKKILEEIVQDYQHRVMPFEKIRQSHCVESIPRTELGKPKIPLLKNMLKL